MYRVKLDNGKLVTRHVDQLLPGNSPNDPVQPDDQFKFFNDDSIPTTQPFAVQRQDDVPAPGPRYNLRRLINLQT